MGLQSKLFAGDLKLEAAATSDPAHIVQGAVGEHVEKIQQALIELDGAEHRSRREEDLAVWSLDRQSCARLQKKAKHCQP